MSEQEGSAESAPAAPEQPPPADAAAAPDAADAAPAEPALPAVPVAAPKMTIPAEVQARVGDPKSLDGVSEDELKAILKEYYDRWVNSENEVYDVGYKVKVNDLQIHELEMEVSDMRGKFIIPKLKKVHNFKLMGGEE